MKKRIAILIALLLAVLCAAALADVNINASFPDPEFRKYVQETFDTSGDGNLSQNEINNATNVNVDHLGIKDLTGIEKLTALRVLDCGHNELTHLDLSGNHNLRILNCYYNQLSVLDLSANPLLENLQAYHNQLQTVNVTNCSVLQYFDVCNNQLTTLNLIPLTGAEHIYCAYNGLSALNLTQCAKLKYLIIDCTSITTLDLSRNTALKGLNCIQCPIVKLDLSANPDLDSLSCQATGITSLDIRKNPLLCNLIKQGAPEMDANEIWWGVKNNRYYPSLCVNRSVSITYDGGVYTAPPDGGDPVQPVAVTGIQLNKTKLTLTRTSKEKKPVFQLEATVSPANASNQALEWKSSNTRVAKVDQTGKVTALKAGTAKITCTAKDGSGVTATCKITVRDQKVTKIILNKTKATLGLGKTLQLKVKKIKPADALNKNVTWKTSDKKVARVSKNGKVKAVGKGTCYIVCMAADGSKVKASCRIRVK